MVDNLPPRGSFTLAPQGGFHSVMGMTSAALFCNLPTTQHCQWDDQRHPKLLAFISGGNGERVQNAERIQCQIADRFNTHPATPLVGPPGLVDGPGPDPFCWLISGLPITQAQILLDEGLLCSDGLATFFLPYAPPITGYLGTFHRFTMPKDDVDLAHTIIAGAISDNPTIARFVR
ncbi:hypothetical protein C8R44DRAFT_892883 [Mycena epipterygia]|nr:hypothetical protein C8R44DRAFT_892883 [Mycena epipterygia]